MSVYICEKCKREYKAKYNKILCPECRKTYKEVKICTNCKKPFVTTDIYQKCCPECKEKRDKAESAKIHVGETYHNTKVLRFFEGSVPPMWECECLVCHTVFTCSYNTILYRNKDCANCRKQKRNEKRKEELSEKYLGKTFGYLKVIDIDMGNRNRHLVCQCKCGNISNYSEQSFKYGLKMCQKCSLDFLENGWEFGKLETEEKTRITAIDGRRALNSNNKTGYTGVSWHKESNKYRAVICFKRRQYYLGLFDEVEEAVQARKNAEKEIFGTFLEEYKKENPEKWEIIQKTRKDKQN